jgi:hypothetical protein
MATDLERLIVTIEANTKQFENAMRSLDKASDTGMRRVERSISASLARQAAAFARFGDNIGGRLTRSLTKGLAEFFTVKFIKDSIEASAKAGDASSKEFLGYWLTVLQRLEEQLGSALTVGWKVALREILNDLNSIIAEVNIGIGKLNELSAASGGLFPKIRQGPIPYLGDMFHVSTADALKKYREEYEKTADAVSKLGKLQAPGAEQLADFDKVMKDLIFEEKQLGRTAEMQRVYNELKKAGVNIESEYGQAIQITAQRLHQEELQLQALKEANDGLEASSKTFIQGLVDGQSAAASFTAALLDMALHNLFNPGGTPLLQGLFGNLLGLGQWTGGKLPGSGGSQTASVSNTSLGAGGRMGGGFSVQHNTSINVQGSVDAKTLSAMKGMIERNNVRQNQELQRTWGNRQSRYAALRGP